MSTVESSFTSNEIAAVDGNENSWLAASPPVGSTFQTITVEWMMGLDASHVPCEDDELRILAEDGSVLSRTLLRDVDRDAYPSLGRAALRVLCPGFGGSFVLALYDTTNHRRFLASPFTVEGLPPNRGEGKISVLATTPGGPMTISYSPSEVFGGTFLVCNAASGDNDGHLTSGLFDEKNAQIFTTDGAKVVESHLGHSFTTFAPKKPGTYQVRYVKTALCSVPHCVACSEPFTIEDSYETMKQAIASRLISTSSFSDNPSEANTIAAQAAPTNEITDLNLRNLRGRLTIFPSVANIGDRITVRYEFFVSDSTSSGDCNESDPTAKNLMKELSEIDTIQCCPYGRAELIQQTESVTHTVQRKMISGAISIVVPNAEGLYDISYFAFLSQVPLLRCDTPLRVLPMPCQIERPFSTKQIVTATSFSHGSVAGSSALFVSTDSNMEQSPSSTSPLHPDQHPVAVATTEEEAGRIDFVVGEGATGPGDFICAVDAQGSLVARIAVDHSQSTSVPEEEAKALMEKLLAGAAIVGNPGRETRLVRGFVVLPLAAMVKLQYSPSRALTMRYYSTKLGRHFGDATVLIDGLSDDLIRSVSFPDVELVTAATVPLEEQMTVRVKILSGVETISGPMLALVAPDIPDTCFRVDADDPGSLQCVSKKHFCPITLDPPASSTSGAKRVSTTRASLPPVSEPGLYMMRFYAFLGHDGTGTSQRTCFAECPLYISETLTLEEYEPLPEGSMPLKNPAECFVRYHGAATGDCPFSSFHLHSASASPLLMSQQDGRSTSAVGFASEPSSASMFNRRRSLRDASRGSQLVDEANATTGNIYHSSSAYDRADGTHDVTNVPHTTSPTTAIVRRVNDFHGAIVCNTTTDTHSELCATVHIITGSVAATDQLLLLDEHCSTAIRSIPLVSVVGRNVDGTVSRQDGTLTTIMVPPIEISGLYFLAYYSAVLDAIPIVSKPIAVQTATEETIRRSHPAAYIQSAQRIGAEARSHDVQVYQPELKSFRALLVGCYYQAREFELRGSYNDVRLVDELLEQTLNVPSNNIVKLTEVEEQRDQKPTCSNILRELEAACISLKRGDTFFFYFSGLGTLYTPLGTGSTERALLPVDFDWGPRVLQYRTLFGFIKRLETAGVNCRVILDAGFSVNLLDICFQSNIWNPSASSNIMSAETAPVKSTQISSRMLLNPSLEDPPEGVQRLWDKRKLTGMDPHARSRSLCPPSGMWPQQGDDQNAGVAFMKDWLIPVKNLDTISNSPSTLETQIPVVVLYEAGRRATWECFSHEEGRTSGVFTASFCQAVREEHARSLASLKKKTFMQLSSQTKHATYAELQAMASKKHQDVPLTTFSSWEELHERILRNIWNSPYKSQKPSFSVSFIEAYRNPAFSFSK